METETKTERLIRETIAAMRVQAQAKFDRDGLPRYLYNTRVVTR